MSGKEMMSGLAIWVLGGALLVTLSLGADESVSVLGHSRFYRGERQAGTSQGVRVSTRAMDDQSQTEDEYLGSGVGEAAQIRKIYGLSRVFMVNQGSWMWRTGKPAVLMKIFGQEGDRTTVRIRHQGGDHFDLQIYEGEAGVSPAKPYLAVAFELSVSHTSVFGFEDGRGAPCFFSFHRSPFSPPVKGGAEPSEAVFPQYPPRALREGVEGVVALLAPLGQDGCVDEAGLTVHAGPPALIPCAREAFLHTRWVPAGREGGRVRPGHVALVVLFALQPPGGDDLAPAEAYRRSEAFSRLKEAMKAAGQGPWLLKMILVSGHRDG